MHGFKLNRQDANFYLRYKKTPHVSQRTGENEKEKFERTFYFLKASMGFLELMALTFSPCDQEALGSLSSLFGSSL